MSTSDLITRYVHILVKTAHRANWGVNAICAKAGVVPEQILDENRHSRRGYSAEQLAVIVHEMSRYDDFLGQFPGSEKPGAFALMCEFSLLSNTLGEALERGFRYYNLMSDVVSINLVLEDATANIDILFLDEDADPENLMREWWPRMWHRLLGWLIGENVPLEQVLFSHQAMGSVEDYEQVFACPCLFEQPSTRLEFDAKWLERPVCRELGELEAYLHFPRLDLVTFPGDETSLKLRIEWALRRYFVHNHQFPSIERIASECFVCSQTLRRRLHQEDTSYTKIKQEIKRELVTEYLENDRLSLSEVARLGGFAEASGLTRAIKAWYGVSPRRYRARYLEARNSASARC
ncbi:AraC family transcriptional regulator [Seongchinamella unica]|uniref:AraC family transcriptional regulator n=1 Tax=Seongchinamella unica TaxID=2547392 RepID=A0A4R5LMR4_9GAMM|nr:AraC family transcriptional regulator [Seongchinamella unica]TDG11308.1 AraC family transcriptional regulator [Seongchinamella unica]